MSVQKDKRTEGRLALSVLARDHAKYVIQITSNEKTFPPMYRHTVTDGLVRQAKDIHRFIWAANNIRVLDESDYEARHKLQKRAVLLCNTLLADMEIAHKLFHLSAKRMRYWTGMLVEIRNKTNAWIQSDTKRYK